MTKFADEQPGSIGPNNRSFRGNSVGGQENIIATDGTQLLNQQQDITPYPPDSTIVNVQCKETYNNVDGGYVVNNPFVKNNNNNNNKSLSSSGNNPTFELFGFLRGAFAILVVYHHIGSTCANGDIRWFDRSVAPLVQGFMMLSGVIFEHVYAKDIITHRETARGYFIKRFARLYPLALFAMIIAAIGGLYMNTLPRKVTPPLWNYTIFWNLSLLIGVCPEIDIKGHRCGALVVPLWSLSAEIISYAIFFISFWIIGWIIKKCNGSYQTSQLCTTLFSIILATLAIIQIIVDTSGESWNSVRLARTWNGVGVFFTGVLIGKTYPFLLQLSNYILMRIMGISIFDYDEFNNPGRRAVDFVRTLIFGLIVCVMTFCYFLQHYYSEPELTPVWISVWCFWAPILLCITQMSDYFYNQKFITLCRFLANISFSIYVFHYPFMKWMGKLINKNDYTAIQSYIGMTIVMPLALSTAWVCYMYFELPLQTAIRNALLKPSKKSAAASSSSAAVSSKSNTTVLMHSSGTPLQTYIKHLQENKNNKSINNHNNNNNRSVSRNKTKNATNTSLNNNSQQNLFLKTHTPSTITTNSPN